MADVSKPVFEMVEDANVTKARPRAGFSELGRTGLKWTRPGYVEEEFLVNLSGNKAIEVYKEMRDNDPIIGAVMMALLNLVRQASWDVEPFSDSPQHVADADFVRECMHDMDRPWSEFISDVMSMVVFGWSFFEIVYKIRSGGPIESKKGSRYTDGKVGWGKFGIRSQDSLEHWEFTPNGEITGMIQRPWPDFDQRFIPLRRSILFRTSVWKDNPEGRSILRNAYRPWFFKKRFEEMEGIGVERDINGIPMARVPPEMLSGNPEQAQALSAVEKMVKNVRNDSQAGLIVPALYDDKNNRMFDIELLTTLGRRSFDTNVIITRLNRTIATSMLADFLVVGQENVGSFAMASSKTKVFSVAIGSYMDAITDQFNRVAIPRLMAMNGRDGAELPKMIHGDIETIDLDELAVYINALSGAGLDLTGEQVREHLAEQAGLPSQGIDVREVENQPFFSGESTVSPDGMKEKPSNNSDDDGDEE